MRSSRLYLVFLILTVAISPNVYMLEWFVHGKSENCVLETHEEALDITFDIGVETIAMTSFTVVTILNPVISSMILLVYQGLYMLQAIY